MKATDIRFCAVWKKPLFFLAFLPCIFISCGIDDEPYLEPVDASSVVVTANTSARVTTDVANEGDYSPSFLLYYKIYISSASESGTISSADMSRINTTLGSDYSGISTYTTLNTTNRPVFSLTVFSNRNFYPMIVNSSETISGSGTITLNFENQPSRTIPSLELNGETQTLDRSTGGGSFVPLPETDRRFRNFAELRDTQNKDVAQTSEDNNDYSYCAVYIIKRGVNSQTLAAIYSAPTFIAVFRLPDRY